MYVKTQTSENYRTVSHHLTEGMVTITKRRNPRLVEWALLVTAILNLGFTFKGGNFVM